MPLAHVGSSFRSIGLRRWKKSRLRSTRRKLLNAAGLNVLASALFFNNRKIILDRAAALRLPAMYQWPEWAEEGGLIGYGPRILQLYRDIMSRQLAALLRGTKPADLPVEQPTRFELVINLKAAQAIGHDIPAGLVLRADKVIE
jgi:putative tryptophan/tyrosine transport system substrate-binding protein